MSMWVTFITVQVCLQFFFIKTSVYLSSFLIYIFSPQSWRFFVSMLNITYELLLIKRYNLYKVLACSTTFFQLSLFCATFFQFPTFMLFISSKTSSSQRVLGLPTGLLDMGFHLLIFCTILSSAMRSTWPKHFDHCFLINPIIFFPFNISFISWLFLVLH